VSFILAKNSHRFWQLNKDWSCQHCQIPSLLDRSCKKGFTKNKSKYW